MICEKCGKHIGDWVEVSKDKKEPKCSEKVVICPSCKAIYCKECADKMNECECCGTKIKK